MVMRSKRYPRRAFGTIGRMRIVSLLPSTTEILFADRRRRRRRRGDLRVRPPARGPRAPHRLDQRPARGARLRRRSTPSSTAAMQRRRGPLPPRRGRACRAGRRPGGHPGPVRGLRRGRLGGRRRAGPPRLHGRGADDRPAHARGGAGLGRARWVRRPATSRRRTRAGPRCGTGSTRASAPQVAGAGPGLRRGCCCWSGPTRRSRPATGCRRWSRPRAAYPRIGAAGEKSVRVTWDEALASRPDVVVCAPCGYDLAGAAGAARAAWSPPGELPGRAAGLGRGRQRLVRAARVHASSTAWRPGARSSTRRGPPDPERGAADAAETCVGVVGATLGRATPPLESVGDGSGGTRRRGHSMTSDPQHQPRRVRG